MKKFILIVPSFSKGKISLNESYIKKIQNDEIPYYICDYNIKNIYYENIAGILLTGGGDIDPSLYGQKMHTKTNDINKKRDIFEIKLIQNAYKNNIPILGICKGIQTINIALGGDIHQHIDGHMQTENRHIKTHSINIHNNTKLYDIIQNKNINVNSIHHQSVFNIGSSLRICAKCKDIIEGIESVDKDRFILGLQWHPEAIEDENSDKIFKYFIKMCINRQN